MYLELIKAKCVNLLYCDINNLILYKILNLESVN